MKNQSKNPPEKRFYRTFGKSLAAEIKKGAVGVLPTDTIYGLVGSALLPEAVLRIYRLRKRDPEKPFVVIIASVFDLELFGVKLKAGDRKALDKVWPGKVSVVLPVGSQKFRYLHRGTKSVAFRLPAKISLRRFVKFSGPLVAPSANPEGEPPAANIKEAFWYFGRRADFYAGVGDLNSPPSTLVILKNGRIKILRAGAGLINKRLLC
jgi:L-threonylcarbamoyladenylate synthase